jgi:hypothetical protein
MSERESGAVLVDPLGGLLLDPSNELKFKGPFDDYVTVALSIRNPTEKRIAFKIKTTAPKRYCVKPNSGVLDPSQSMKVNGKHLNLHVIFNDSSVQNMEILEKFSNKILFNSFISEISKYSINIYKIYKMHN